MLENLDSIDWAHLEHAYGSADDVPDYIHALCSTDEDVRSNAIGDLFGTVWHQGTIYSASPHVVPFLAELLEAADVPGKELIAVLLACIASGTGYYQVHGEIFRKQGKSIVDIDAKLQDESEIVRAVRHASHPYIPLLIPYLKHPEPSVREAIAKALALYPDYFAASKKALEEARAIESDEDTLREIENALAEIPHTA